MSSSVIRTARVASDSIKSMCPCRNLPHAQMMFETSWAPESTHVKSHAHSCRNTGRPQLLLLLAVGA